MSRLRSLRKLIAELPGNRVRTERLLVPQALMDELKESVAESCPVDGPIFSLSIYAGIPVDIDPELKDNEVGLVVEIEDEDV